MRTFVFANGETITFPEDTTAADLLEVVFSDVFGQIDVLTRPITNFRGEKVGEDTILRHNPTGLQMGNPENAGFVLKTVIQYVNRLS